MPKVPKFTEMRNQLGPTKCAMYACVRYEGSSAITHSSAHFVGLIWYLFGTFL